MFGKPYRCRVLETKLIAAGVLSVRFEPCRKLPFEPGQFLSLVVPGENSEAHPQYRLYSFASGPERSREEGYEICVKLMPGGVASEYLLTLRKGDEFQARAPYGDFLFRAPAEGRHLCFIGTGTGIAPLKAMIESDKFLQSEPPSALLLMGFRHEDEIFFKGTAEANGVLEVCCVSDPASSWKGFRGRVTDYLRTAPRLLYPRSTDFYICGNPEMVEEVMGLIQAIGADPHSIFHESFHSHHAHPHPTTSAPAQQMGKGLITPVFGRAADHAHSRKRPRAHDLFLNHRHRRH